MSYGNSNQIEQLSLDLIGDGEVSKKPTGYSVSTYALRVVKESTAKYGTSNKITCTKDAADLFREVFEMEYLAEEMMAMFTLDTKNKVTGAFSISHGALNSSIVHPREIFKRALLQNAASIIISHNHPSGDPTPSVEDKNVTNRLREAGKIIGIDVIDHIIIGDDSYFSFKEKGLL